MTSTTSNFSVVDLFIYFNKHHWFYFHRRVSEFLIVPNFDGSYASNIYRHEANLYYKFIFEATILLIFA